jgi:hypothetical protein
MIGEMAPHHWGVLVIAAVIVDVGHGNAADEARTEPVVLEEVHAEWNPDGSQLSGIIYEGRGGKIVSSNVRFTPSAQTSL